MYRRNFLKIISSFTASGIIVSDLRFMEEFVDLHPKPDLIPYKGYYHPFKSASINVCSGDTLTAILDEKKFYYNILDTFVPLGITKGGVLIIKGEGSRVFTSKDLYINEYN